MKSLKLWFYYDKSTIKVDPRMIKKVLLNCQIDISDISKLNTIKLSNELSLDSACWFLGDLEIETNIVTCIDKICSSETLLTESALEEAMVINKKEMEKERAILTASKFEKPSELFLSKQVWDFVNSSIDLNLYPLFIGPKGSGKTSTAYALAKARGMEFFPINCGAIFKPKQTLVGTTQAKDGTTFQVDSEFLRHFKSEKPTLIFLDEISRIPAAAANYFMTILDEIQSYIYVEDKGERIYKGADVVFCAAANFGFEYTDTRNLDGALLDRFIKFQIDYLPQDQEIELIMQRTFIKKAEAKSLVKYATHCREQAEKLKVAVSTRQLINMGKYIKAGHSMKEVIDVIFLNLFINGSQDLREEVTQMLNAVS